MTIFLGFLVMLVKLDLVQYLFVPFLTTKIFELLVVKMTGSCKFDLLQLKLLSQRVAQKTFILSSCKNNFSKPLKYIYIYIYILFLLLHDNALCTLQYISGVSLKIIRDPSGNCSIFSRYMSFDCFCLPSMLDTLMRLPRNSWPVIKLFKIFLLADLISFFFT